MSTSGKKQKVGVFVLGPINRSPRMLNHSLSLSQFTDLQVDFIGYEGSGVPNQLKNSKVNIKYIDTKIIDVLKKLPKQLYIFYALIRIILQVTQLFLMVVFGNYDYILMQNPPCVPIMAVVVVYRWI